MTSPQSQAVVTSLPELVERLKQEAQIHAQEARTANATIAEIYQLCTGATGEPGNWNGAEPVRALIAAHEADVGLRKALEKICEGAPTEWPERYEGDNHGDTARSASEIEHFHMAEIARAALTQGETK
jgi:hypothetical protein